MGIPHEAVKVHLQYLGWRLFGRRAMNVILLCLEMWQLGPRPWHHKTGEILVLDTRRDDVTMALQTP